VGFAGKNSSFLISRHPSPEMAPFLLGAMALLQEEFGYGTITRRIARAVHAIARGTAWHLCQFKHCSLAVDPSRRSLVRQFARARTHAFSAD
jgi:hypothetical protein